MSCVLRWNECFKMLNNEGWYRCLIPQLVSAKMVGKK
jgi:predicted SAM-dependent methyltransferase